MRAIFLVLGLASGLCCSISVWAQYAEPDSSADSSSEPASEQDLTKPAQSDEIIAWRHFTRQLEAAGIDILSTYPQPSALDRAEGLRYLLQQLSSAIERTLVGQPSEIPLMRIGATTINKWGMDAADAKYQLASIDSKGDYRLRGQLGSARLFALQQASMSGDYAAFGALTGGQLQAQPDGNFELRISAERPADWDGAWLELATAADSIGVSNWLDPAGHSHGALLFRMQVVDKFEQPKISLLKLDDLQAHLPSDTPRVTPLERRDQIKQRRAHAAVRWAP